MRSRYDYIPSFAPGQATPHALLLFVTIHSYIRPNSVVLTPRVAHPSQSSHLKGMQHATIEASPYTQSIHPWKTREPSSKNANPFLATTTKICSQNPSTCAHAHPSQESCCPLTRQCLRGFGLSNSIPSIFLEAQFGRYVVTRFLADANLHGHRPTVKIRLSSYHPLL